MTLFNYLRNDNKKLIKYKVNHCKYLNELCYTILETNDKRPKMEIKEYQFLL